MTAKCSVYFTLLCYMYMPFCSDRKCKNQERITTTILNLKHKLLIIIITNPYTHHMVLYMLPLWLLLPPLLLVVQEELEVIAAIILPAAHLVCNNLNWSINSKLIFSYITDTYSGIETSPQESHPKCNLRPLWDCNDHSWAIYPEVKPGSKRGLLKNA